ncbi:hypothetical protein ACH4KT_16430 [Streptomyces anulatus]
MREFQLDDVDLGNRRLVLAGRARPLDDLNRQATLGQPRAVSAGLARGPICP